MQQGRGEGSGEVAGRGVGSNYSQLLRFSEEQGSAKINKTYYSRPVSAGRRSRKHTLKKQDMNNEKKKISAIGFSVIHQAYKNWSFYTLGV